MSCMRCAREIEADSSFCRYCGAAQGPGQGSSERSARRLQRFPEDGQIAGVCAGLAGYVDTDVTVIRLAWIFLSIVPGAIVGGLVAYVVAWALIPAAATGAPRLATGRRLARSDDDRMIAGVCGGLASHFGVDVTIMRVACAVLAVYPGAIVGGLIAYVIAWAVIPGAHDLETASRPA